MLEANYISIDKDSDIDKDGKKHRVYLKKAKDDKTIRYEKLTDIFSKEEAQKIEEVFRLYKIVAIEIGNTMIGKNNLFFYGEGFLDSYSALFYSFDDKKYFSDKGHEFINIDTNWYLLHSV